MKSSASLAIVTAVLLAGSLALKLLLTAAHAPDAAGVERRSQALGRFLVAHAGPVQPEAKGWRVTRADCELLAYPSGVRGAMEMTALAGAEPGDRVAYVYRGRLAARPPDTALALDEIAWLARRPFLDEREPGYVVLIAHRCPRLPDLPWERLGV